MDSSEDLIEMLKGAAAASPSPFAHYSSHLDCIRIQIRDCSFFERRINEYVTVVYDNYPEEGQGDVVGFLIKGIKHLFNRAGLPHRDVVRVARLFDELAKAFPEILTGEVQKLVESLRELELTVSFPEEAVAA